MERTTIHPVSETKLSSVNRLDIVDGGVMKLVDCRPSCHSRRDDFFLWVNTLKSNTIKRMGQ